VAKPPRLEAENSTKKNEVSLTIHPPPCNRHGVDTGYVHGYVVYYYPAKQPGK